MAEEIVVKEEIELKDDIIKVGNDSFAVSVIRYNRSFTARLIQSQDEVKNWYVHIKNALLGYKKVKDRMSWKRETYRKGRIPLVRMAFRGKTLCLYFALNPLDFAETKYKVEDASESATYVDTPCMYRIKNDRRAKYAIDLIAMVMEKFEVTKLERESVDYYLPYEGLVELLERKLIKREDVFTDLINKGIVKIEIVEGKAPFERDDEEESLARRIKARNEALIKEIAKQSAEGEVIIGDKTEEQVEAKGEGAEDKKKEPENKAEVAPEQPTVKEEVIPLYDKSFRARVIQSRDATKQLYSDIKNKLLSYKGIRSRFSWDYESFSSSEKSIAKIAFSGKTLCIYLPLSYADYADSQYAVEDASSEESLPLRLLLKNYDQYLFALEIIDRVMTENDAELIPSYTPVNYYEISQPTVALLKQGLVKRNIDSKAISRPRLWGKKQ